MRFVVLVRNSAVFLTELSLCRVLGVAYVALGSAGTLPGAIRRALGAGTLPGATKAGRLSELCNKKPPREGRLNNKLYFP